MSKGRVGRGLASLIPESALDDAPAPDTPAAGRDGVLKVPLAELLPNPEQPREVFDEKELDQLTESIQAHGVLSPLVVRRQDGKYFLIAGERRMRAAGRAGLTEVPVIVREASDGKVQLELALVENLQRADLDPIEAAKGFQRLEKEYGYTHQQIASAVGKKRSTISNLIRLLLLPDIALEALRNGKITVGHAKALLPVSDDEAKLKQVLARIVEHELNVRQVEALISELENPPARSSKARPRDSHVEYVERLLGDALQTTVAIAPKPRGGGRITIDYSSDEELDRLIEMIQNEEA